MALGNVHVVPTTTNLPQTETEKKVIVSFSISVHLISQKSPCLSPHLGLAPSLRLYGLNGDNLKSSFIFCLPCPRIQIFPPPFSRSSNFKVKHACWLETHFPQRSFAYEKIKKSKLLHRTASSRLVGQGHGRYRRSYIETKRGSSAGSPELHGGALFIVLIMVFGFKNQWLLLLGSNERKE